MFKGAEVIDLGFFAPIAAIILGIALFIVALSVFYLKLNITSNVNLLVETDSRGSAFLSLMKTEKENINYAEIIGSLHIKNLKEDIKKEVEDTLKKLDIELATRDEANKHLYQKVDDSVITAEIALPGGRKGKAEIA